jgi:GNAT superfamily N-acetyltransferase
MDLTVVDEPYDSADARALVAALHAEIDERYAYEMVGWTDEERAADAAAYLAEVTAASVQPPHGVFVVARLDGRPVACGAVKAIDDAYLPHIHGIDRARRIGEIKRMFTVVEARRRGVSRSLLAHLEERAAVIGYDVLVLETGTAQPEALALYEATGWTRTPAYGHYRDSPDSVCFAKELRPLA